MQAKSREILISPTTQKPGSVEIRRFPEQIRTAKLGRELPAALRHFLPFDSDSAGPESGVRIMTGSEATLPRLLMLDEPTNYLHIESIEVIEAALRDYDGALLLLSPESAFREPVGIAQEIRL